MEKSLERTLFTEGRRLYRNGLQWGFECCDGWFLLLVDLTRNLEKLCENQEATSPMPVMAARQVKEKFGGLRFYLEDAAPAASKLIREAEHKALTICELCGEPGRLCQIGGWFQTLCDAHAKAWVRREHETNNGDEDPLTRGLFRVPPGIYPEDALGPAPLQPLSSKEATWLSGLEPGALAIRWLGGCCMMQVKVTEVTPETILCGPFRFSRLTGAELDPALGWTAAMSGSWIRTAEPD